LAKAPARRLKVFQAQFGFYDSVVAAPSQAAALRAWGVHQNLFADGRAQITEDGQAIEAALAHPETPLRRAVGSTDPFALEPTSLPKVPDAPPRAAAKPEPKAKSAARPKPPADRSALNVAEAELRKLDEARKREEADFRRRQAELDAVRDEAQARYVEGRKAATAAVVAARGDFRKAGGAD
jgi:type IV secretory pathway VirB10-like protein